MNKLEIIELLKQYNPDNEAEIEYKNRIIDFISKNDIYFGKGNPDGHLTGSAWIVNSNRDKVLLTNHIKLKKWIQLGGHTETDENILYTSYRETLEESGLSDIKVISKNIFDVDVHFVPAIQKEKEHYHYDIRFVFEADDSELLTKTNESKELKWINIDDVKNYSHEETIYRMVRKTKGLK